MGAVVHCKVGGNLKAKVGLAQQAQNLEDTKAVVGPLITSLETIPPGADRDLLEKSLKTIRVCEAIGTNQSGLT